MDSVTSTFLTIFIGAFLVAALVFQYLEMQNFKNFLPKCIYCHRRIFKIGAFKVGEFYFCNVQEAKKYINFKGQNISNIEEAYKIWKKEK